MRAQRIVPILAIALVLAAAVGGPTVAAPLHPSTPALQSQPAPSQSSPAVSATHTNNGTTETTRVSVNPVWVVLGVLVVLAVLGVIFGAMRGGGSTTVIHEPRA